jgi:hypothetical protein
MIYHLKYTSLYIHFKHSLTVGSREQSAEDSKELAELHLNISILCKYSLQ